MTVRLAIVVSHPIQHFAPWHREVARDKDIDLRVFFCCDWGTETYFDAEFQSEFKWDIPLLDGYEHEFLPISSRPTQLNYRQVDNPGVDRALDRFNPDVVKVFGYTYKTNWRVAQWTRRTKRPLLLYSDSNGGSQPQVWKRIIKQVVVGRFYNKVDGALFVGDNNFEYHRRYGLPVERLFQGSLPIDQSQLRRVVPDRALARRQLREQYSIPMDAFVVMFCGKYSARKRPLDVVEAAHKASQRGFPIWSLMVGEGSERPAMEAYCDVNKVRNAVLTGFVNQGQIPHHYAASDAIVISSEHDPHPLVVSEAATFGLPALVSDQVGCVGAQDTARPGVSALVYRCGDREALAAAIIELFENPTRYRELSEGASNISQTQDVTVAAKYLSDAAQQLAAMGPRQQS